MENATAISRMSRSTVHCLTAQWVLPISAPPIENGYVRVENGKIQAIGAMADPDAPADLPPPVPGSVLTPGLVNTHIHLEQSFPEPIPKHPREPFVQWLQRVTERNRTQNDPAQLAARCRDGVQELLATGTTCVNDIATTTDSLHALEKAGLRGIVSMECFHPDWKTVEVRDIIRRFEVFKTAYEHHPCLRIGLSPHAPYTVSPAAWQALLDAAQPACIHTHVAEFEDEVAYLQGRPSGLDDLFEAVLGRRFVPQEAAPSPVRLLHRFGLLNDRTVVAHAIQTDAQDQALLYENGCTLAHCPRSNLALHGQTLHWPDWQDSLIPIGLGTDGRLSTENLDLRAEARQAMARHGLSATTVLKSLTLDGARTLRMADQVGTLTPGQWADMVMWHANPAQPGNPADWVLAAETRPVAVMVAGAIRWQTA